jgi:mono/diheme cytochrome c family protein
MTHSKPLMLLAAALAALSLTPATRAADAVAMKVMQPATQSATQAATQSAVRSAMQLAAQPYVSPALDAAGEGRRQYLRLNCYSCHGMFAAGGMGPDIVGAEHGDVSEAVLQGEEGGMPSFRNYVTSTDITNLTAYLDSIGKQGSPVFMDWWVKNPKK